jgi:hypothetical protein
MQFNNQPSTKEKQKYDNSTLTKINRRSPCGTLLSHHPACLLWAFARSASGN